MNTIRIATRNSPLALWQANFVKDQLQSVHPDLNVEVVGMTTKGDQLLDRSLAAVGGKGLFLKELEVSLLNEDTDIAVHSMKDVPVELPEGLEIAALCERADARDAMVSNKFQNLNVLPEGSVIGTSSLRRISQLKNAFPGLRFVELRGNVNTRLKKLDDGKYDAIILAAAGLIRLGFIHRIKQYIDPKTCLPAVGQGIVGIECRVADDKTKALLQSLHNRESEIVLTAERAMNAALDGGCQVPIAGYAEVADGNINMHGRVGKPDGSAVLTGYHSSQGTSLMIAKELGEQVAQDLLAQGAKPILEGVYRDSISLSERRKPIVLLTRQACFLGNSREMLKRLDYDAVHVPTIAVQASDEAAVLAQFSNLDRFTDLVFVSRNAVEIGMKMINDQGGLPNAVRVMAVGAETAKQLYQYDVDALFPDTGNGAQALLDVQQMADLDGRKILIVRGHTGLDWPAEEMHKRGAQVESVKCYQQAIPEQSQLAIQEVISRKGKIEGIFVHSQQSFGNLLSIAQSHTDTLFNAILVAGSQRIAELAKESGWKGRIITAQSPSNKDMMIAFSG